MTIPAAQAPEQNSAYGSTTIHVFFEEENGMECLRNTQFRRCLLTVAAFGVILLMTSSSAMATLAPVPAVPVTPGNFVAPSDVTGDTVGTLLASMVSPFSNASTGEAGNVISAVFQESDQTLDFYYQVVLTSGTPITSEANVHFAGWMTSVAYRTDGSGLCGIPLADCTAHGGTSPFTDGTVFPFTGQSSAPNGDSITFNFSPPTSNELTAGQTSNVLIIQTDAKNYAAGVSGVIFGPTSNVTTYEPASGVPEPASMALIGGGLLMLAGFRKFAKKH